MASQISLFLGGAASGKSALAEQQVTATGLDRIYIATAQAFDPEMQAKIDRHIADRGPGWTTIETPIDVTSALSDLGPDHIVLIDCATLWLSNLMLKDAQNPNIAAHTDQLIAAMQSCHAQITIVSNEVGQGIVPANALSRQFREEQGRLNIRLAQTADNVVQVVAGLPNVLKGRLS